MKPQRLRRIAPHKPDPASTYTPLEAAAFEEIIKALRDCNQVIHAAILRINENRYCHKLGFYVDEGKLVELMTSEKWKLWYSRWEVLQAHAAIGICLPMLPGEMARELAIRYMNHLGNAVGKGAAFVEQVRAEVAEKRSLQEADDGEDLFGEDDDGPGG